MTEQKFKELQTIKHRIDSLIYETDNQILNCITVEGLKVVIKGVAGIEFNCNKVVAATFSVISKSLEIDFGTLFGNNGGVVHYNLA